MSDTMVDWDLAVSTARRLVRPGPQISLSEAADVVAQLRGLAVEAEEHVRAVTGLAPPPGSPQPSAAHIVDRAGWVEANIGGLRTVVTPLVDRLAVRRSTGPGSGVVDAVGRRLTGVQVGTLLSYLAGKVLGQYEVFLPAGQGTGRLTLVAPNLIATERSLDLPPHDFRLWVCLHEVTHQAQFTAVPWMHEYVASEVAELVAASDLDPAALRARLRAAAGAAIDSARGRAPAFSLLDAVQTPEQRIVTDRLTGLMTLLEGHAEYVMDGVGPDVVPAVALIRERFDERRASGTGALDRVLRRLLGLDLKMRQYADGSRFVHAVVKAHGMAAFNQVWTSPQTLPTKAETTDPGAWAARVLGAPALTAGA